MCGFTSLAPGERIDLLYVAASGQRTLIATVRLPLGLARSKRTRVCGSVPRPSKPSLT